MIVSVVLDSYRNVPFCPRPDTGQRFDVFWGIVSLKFHCTLVGLFVAVKLFEVFIA